MKKLYKNEGENIVQNMSLCETKPCHIWNT